MRVRVGVRALIRAAVPPSASRMAVVAVGVRVGLPSASRMAIVAVGVRVSPTVRLEDGDRGVRVGAPPSASRMATWRLG